VLPPVRRPRSSISPSGTAVEERRAPVAAIVLAVAALGVVVAAYFLFRGGGAKPEELPPVPDQPPAMPATPLQGPGPTPTPSVAPTPAAPTGPSADSLAVELQRALDRQRLWSRVEVAGAVVEVTSESCGDAALKPVIDAAAARLKAAGTSRLRCRDESGTVVFTRDL